MAHFPAGSSFKQSIHYMQSYAANTFAQFDYGELENMRRYGNPKPPRYPVEKINIPIALFYCQNDKVVNPRDTRRLIKLLPNVVADNLMPNKAWNHVSILLSESARELVYKKILILFKKYEWNQNIK